MITKDGEMGNKQKIQARKTERTKRKKEIKEKIGRQKKKIKKREKDTDEMEITHKK